ncbi:MAG: hypothetical protein N2512_08960, partial [Armatimonadetes bacterium]|nr:hypothetical protein [Armatimonadota bacterium]
GHEAVVTKGGLMRLDGTLEVRFLYRSGIHSVMVAPDAPADAVRQAIADRLSTLDEALDLAELVGAEVET